MAKRPASMGILCPGCSANFDLSLHSLHFGSCGHSLCSVCVSEKKINICPTCNDPRGFLVIQKRKAVENRSSSVTEDDAKKSKLEAVEKPKEPIPAILDPNNRLFLVDIVNQLDPDSFVKFARSCKEMYSFCFNTTAIKIIHADFTLDVERRRRSPVFRLWKEGEDVEYSSSSYKKKFGEILNSRKNGEKMSEYPFQYQLRKLHTHLPLTAALLDSIRSYLIDRSLKKINTIWTPFIADWNAYRQFVKDFKCSAVNAGSGRFPDDVDDEVFHYFLQNTTSFRSGLNFPARFILNASVPRLTLRNARISRETFSDLIMRFAHSTENINWRLRRDPSFPFGHLNLFDTILKFTHPGPVPSNLPIVLLKYPLNLPRFYILRKDGKIVRLVGLRNRQEIIHISMLHPSDFPHFLKANPVPVA